MTGTHDLPTIAGWWRGRDLDWNRQLGRAVSDDVEETRARARSGWWDSFTAGVAHGPQPAPDDGDPVVDAALGFVGRTPCHLAIVPLEDVVGLVEQPNLPGTTTQHPNWRRRMPADAATLLAQPAVAAHVATLNASRTA
jgi:4-alpha-glucanotransferase